MWSKGKSAIISFEPFEAVCVTGLGFCRFEITQPPIFVSYGSGKLQANAGNDG